MRDVAIGVASWLCRPLAAENRTPFPAHGDRQTTARVTPPVYPEFSQPQLYSRGGDFRIGAYRESAWFPLVRQEEGTLVTRAAILQISKRGVQIDQLPIDTVEDFRRQVNQTKRNVGLLVPNQPVGSTLIAALPDSSVELLADILELLFDLGEREVRLLSGRPETTARPTLGAVTRIVYQSTIVNLVVEGDASLHATQPMIPIPGRFEMYSDLLDRVLELRQASSAPPVFVFSAHKKWRWDGWHLLNGRSSP
jgi:hypothetical protein